MRAMTLPPFVISNLSHVTDPFPFRIAYLFFSQLFLKQVKLRVKENYELPHPTQGGQLTLHEISLESVLEYKPNKK
jgi:hypothetical protein